MDISDKLIKKFTTPQNLYSFFALSDSVIRVRGIYEKARLLVENGSFQVLAVLLPKP